MPSVERSEARRHAGGCNPEWHCLRRRATNAGSDGLSHPVAARAGLWCTVTLIE